jgi:hypothetical protein
MHEEMPNITGHKGNEKQTLRFQLTVVSMAIIKNTTNAGEDEGRKEHLYAVDRNIN